MSLKRISLAVSVLSLLLLGLASCGGDDGTTSGSAGTTTIRVASIAPFSTSPWPLVIADQEGYLQDEGVAVDFTFGFNGGQLLAGGQVDVLGDGADSGMLAAAQGKDIIMVDLITDQLNKGLMTSPDITSVGGLVGKTLRVSQPVGTGTDEYMAHRYLQQHGVSPDQVSWQAIDSEGAALAQLKSGNVAGGMYDQGVMLPAERSGEFNILATPVDMGHYPWQVLQTTRSFADAHSDALVGLIAALEKAKELMRDPANKDQVIADVLAGGQGLTRQDVESTYDAAAFYEDFESFKSAPLTVADLEPARGALIFTGAGQEAKTLDLASLIDNSYYEKATE